MIDEENYEGKKVSYDLREIYTIKILGEHLLDITRARKIDDYPNYFKNLKDLWIICQHKIKKKEGVKEEYHKIVNEAIKIINKYTNSFYKKGKPNPDGVAMIEYHLNKIEMFLYDEIEKIGLFG